MDWFSHIPTHRDNIGIGSALLDIQDKFYVEGDKETDQDKQSREHELNLAAVAAKIKIEGSELYNI